MTAVQTSLSATMIIVVQVAALAEVVVPWLDFSEPRTPVDRPIEELACALNATSCAKSMRASMSLREHPRLGEVAQWSVEPVGTASAEGWAVLRTVLPCWYYTRNRNAIAGVQLHLFVSRETIFRFEVFTGANPFDGFYRPAKLIGRNKGRTVRSGEQDVVFRWAAAGVKEETLPRVSGYGLVLGDAPVVVSIARVDLLFASQADADEYRAQRDRRLRVLQKVMVDSLAARGVGLSALLERLSVDEFEPSLWEGVQLVAMGEQLNHWTRLAARHYGRKGGEKELKVQRDALIGDLARGRDVRKQIDVLQSRVDVYVDRLMNALPVSVRRWRVGKDGRFHRPDGRPYRMFGPYFQRLRYAYPSPAENSVMGWRPWDVRHLAGLGFNGIRADITWKRLEPVQGQFDRAYVELIKRIFREAERYGLGISIDLHWPFPDWFVYGPPGRCIAKGHHAGPWRQNAYHWPEALVSAWRRLAAELADVPNIVAFEVPTNEPTLAVTHHGVMAWPTLVCAWNDWLRQTYKDRRKLADVWGAGDVGAERYRLHQDENWEDGTIRPLGFQDDPARNTAYAYNPRLWDHIRWSAREQTRLTGQILHAVRESVPDAAGMMQYTVGDRHDRSPVPIDYRAIQTLVGAHVVAGTHYGVGGGIPARKAATLSLLAYDSEQQMDNMREYVRAHVKLGLGLCPFSFFHLGRGGRLLADHRGHLKAQVAFLPEMAEWIRTYWPEPKATGPRVAVVINTRLEATTGTLVGDLVGMLEERCCRVGVFEGLRVVRRPDVLRGYDLVVTTGNYMDEDLLGVLDEKFTGSVLVFGRLNRDAYARRPAKGLPAAMVRRKLFLRDCTLRSFLPREVGRIDLTGLWAWRYVGERGEPPTAVPKSFRSAKWNTRPVPGPWGEVGMLGSLRVRLGYAWYRHRIVIPNEWRGHPLQLSIGAIDDEDWTFFNGHLIGKTTAKTPNCYRARRKYAIPNRLIRWGKSNELMICNRNTFRDGGIVKGPAEIVAEDKIATVYWFGETGKPPPPQPLNIGPGATCVHTPDLIDGVNVLARVAGTGPDCPVALARQGRWFWWVEDFPWSKEMTAHATVLAKVLESLAH